MASLQLKINTILYSLVSLCLILLTLGCKETLSKSDSPQQINNLPVYNDSTPDHNSQSLNNTLQNEFSEWPNYLTLNTAIKNLENGNHTFFESPIEDLNQLFLDIKKSTPESLKINGILARVKVTETLTRKLNELYSVENTDLKELDQTKHDLIESHNNLIFQITKMNEKKAQLVIKPN